MAWWASRSARRTSSACSSVEAGLRATDASRGIAGRVDGAALSRYGTRGEASAGDEGRIVPLRLVFTLAVAAWFGTLICLSFVVTPVAHRSFPARQARTMLRPMFRRIYRLGTGLGFVALIAVFLGRDGLPADDIARLASPVAVAVVASLLGGEVLLPKFQSLDGDDPRFARLHQVSAMLNTTSIAALVLALAGAIAR